MISTQMNYHIIYVQLTTITYVDDSISFHISFEKDIYIFKMSIAQPCTCLYITILTVGLSLRLSPSVLRLSRLSRSPRGRNRERRHSFLPRRRSSSKRASLKVKTL